MATNIGNDTGTIHVPPDLLAQAQAVAEEEHRTAEDVVREAIERYLSERAERLRRDILARARARAQALRYTEDDVPRLIAEVRQERRNGRPRA